jgi:PAS domain S-box-containing protein
MREPRNGYTVIGDFGYIPGSYVERTRAEVTVDEAAISLTRAVSGASDDAAGVLVSPPAFLDLLPIAAYACEASGRVRWFNRKAAELWGRSPRIGDDTERFCGSHIVYGLDGTVLRRDETPMAQVLRTGNPVSGKEALVERPDGTRIVTMVHIEPLTDTAGNVIGAISCFHDITDAKHRDRMLRERERQFRDLLQALPAAIYTTDAAGRITFYNEAAVELSGRRPKLDSDEWCVTWRLYRPDGTPLPHGECPMAVALNEDRPVRGKEAIAERPDGTRVPFLPYPTPLHDASGALIGAVNMLVDISQRKEAETQQRLLLAELNHRIKNNMQMLQALLNAARRETPSPEARNALSDAAKRVGAMAAAQKVLYLASNTGAFQAKDFIGAVCSNAHQGFGKGITVVCSADDGELSNDTAVPLALIVNELVTNAAKHGLNGRGEGSIKVMLTKNADCFVLQVEDDGPGFELSETRRRSSGLGLVMGLVRQISGNFTVLPGPGARCRVEFRDEHIVAR